MFTMWEKINVHKPEREKIFTIGSRKPIFVTVIFFDWDNKRNRFPLLFQSKEWVDFLYFLSQKKNFSYENRLTRPLLQNLGG